MKNPIEVSVCIDSTLDKVWKAWTDPECIKIWNVPFADWHCPFVKNEVRSGGAFHFRMEKIDGPDGFDYMGKYKEVVPKTKILIIQDDDRLSSVMFQKENKGVRVVEVFEPENSTDLKQQEEFCQSVLLKFKDFVEGNLCL